MVAEIASLKSSLSLLESKLVSNEEKLENYSTQILVNERIISDLKISFDTESNQKSTFVSVFRYISANFYYVEFRVGIKIFKIKPGISSE